MEKNWTGERLETHIFNDVMIEHLHRYSLAKNYTENKTVLDIACGEGYGTNLLSKNASFVFGVDIDETTILKATQKYTSENISFLTGAADKIPIESSTIDVITSFETIEHHNQHEAMLAEIKRVLKPNGLLIISSPDKKHYSDDRKYANPFHIKELYREEFETLINRFFKHTFHYKQRMVMGSLIYGHNKNTDIQIHSGDYELLAEPHLLTPLYNIAMASDTEFVPANNSIFRDDYQLKTLQEQIAQTYKASWTWKIGNLVLSPFRLFKKKK